MRRAARARRSRLRRPRAPAVLRRVRPSAPRACPGPGTSTPSRVIESPELSVEADRRLLRDAVESVRPGPHRAQVQAEQLARWEQICAIFLAAKAPAGSRHWNR